MRTIKFRAWDTAERKMHHEISLMFANDLNGVFEGLNECGCIVMQYTGLEDKNGVEIYEGDIIFWKDLSDLSDGTLEDAVMVFWDDEHLRWSVETLGNVKAYEELYDYSDSEEIEVIGNIYENKELLEG